MSKKASQGGRSMVALVLVLKYSVMYSNGNGEYKKNGDILEYRVSGHVRVDGYD